METKIDEGIEIREYVSRITIAVQDKYNLEESVFIVRVRISAADVGDILFPISEGYNFYDHLTSDHMGFGIFINYMEYREVWAKIESIIIDNGRHMVKRPIHKSIKEDIKSFYVGGFKIRIHFSNEFNLAEDSSSRFEEDMSGVFPEIFGSFQKLGYSSIPPRTMVYVKKGVDMRLLVTLDDDFKLSSHFTPVTDLEVFGGITSCVAGEFIPDDGIRGFPVFHIVDKDSESHMMFLFHPRDGWEKNNNSGLAENLPLKSISHHEVSPEDDINIVITEGVSLEKIYLNCKKRRT